MYMKTTTTDPTHLALKRADAASAASAVMDVTLDEPREVTLSREVARESSYREGGRFV